MGLGVLHAFSRFFALPSPPPPPSRVAEKEELLHLRAILESLPLEATTGSPLVIEKVLFGRFGDRERWSLEDVEWEVEGEELRVAEDITPLFRLYNQGDRVQLPANKKGLIGFDHLYNLGVADPQLFVAFRRVDDDPARPTCRVFGFEQPLLIQVP